MLVDEYQAAMNVVERKLDLMMNTQIILMHALTEQNIRKAILWK